jgi:hypothetical protein
MADILDLLQKQVLGGDAVDRISQQIGADRDTTAGAISGALPMLIGALSKNAARPEGAQALAGALDRDHDGSVLDDLGGFLGGGGAAGLGAGILGHVLGGKQSAAAEGLSGLSGLDKGSAGQLLAILAPIVLGALGRQKRSQGLDSGGLASWLGKQDTRARQQAPSGVGGLLGGLLDQDGDGSVMDDVAQMGAGLLGNLLKKR